MLEKFKSRKFLAAICGALMGPVLAYLSEDILLAEALQMSAAVIVSYIWGQGYVDGKAAEKNG